MNHCGNFDRLFAATLGFGGSVTKHTIGVGTGASAVLVAPSSQRWLVIDVIVVHVVVVVVDVVGLIIVIFVVCAEHCSSIPGVAHHFLGLLTNS